jgi:hypothetical protein
LDRTFHLVWCSLLFQKKNKLILKN